MSRNNGIQNFRVTVQRPMLSLALASGAHNKRNVTLRYRQIGEPLFCPFLFFGLEIPVDRFITIGPGNTAVRQKIQQEPVSGHPLRVEAAHRIKLPGTERFQDPAGRLPVIGEFKNHIVMIPEQPGPVFKPLTDGGKQTFPNLRKMHFIEPVQVIEQGFVDVARSGIGVVQMKNVVGEKITYPFHGGQGGDHIANSALSKNKDLPLHHFTTVSAERGGSSIPE